MISLLPLPIFLCCLVYNWEIDGDALLLYDVYEWDEGLETVFSQVGKWD
jgi:hypothetical protein